MMFVYVQILLFIEKLFLILAYCSRSAKARSDNSAVCEKCTHVDILSLFHRQ
jgi:hypothetical protein